MAWDLRYPPVNPIREKPEALPPWQRRPTGPLVVPGTFSVNIAKQVDGVVTPLGKPQAVVVESLALATLPAEDKQELLAFQEKAGELQRAMMGAAAAAGEALGHVRAIKKALLNTPKADPRLAQEALALEKGLRDIYTALYGDQVLRRRSEPTAPSLIRRVSRQLSKNGTGQFFIVIR